MDRAKEHLDALKVEAESCVQRHKDAIVQRVDTERGLYLYSFGQLNTPDYRLGVLIGEVAHSIRAALNHLAYALAPTVDFIQFPIFEKTGPQLSKALQNFPPEYRKELNRWQPHNAGKLAQDHPLWIVHKLDIVEKHQCVPTAPMSISMGRPTMIGHDQDGIAILAVPVTPGAPEPDLYPNIAIEVSLDPFPHATKLVPITGLYDAYDYVRNRVLPSIEKLLT